MDKMYHVVAKAVRVEHEEKSDRMYLVFEIIDEKFKKEVRENWTKDVDLKITGKDLIKSD